MKNIIPLAALTLIANTALASNNAICGPEVIKRASQYLGRNVSGALITGNFTWAGTDYCTIQFDLSSTPSCNRGGTLFLAIPTNIYEHVLERSKDDTDCSSGSG
jgi:hypothetical protein